MKDRKDLLSQLTDAAGPVALLRLWNRRNSEEWESEPRAYGLLAGRLLKAGENLAALDVLSEARERGVGDVRTRQLWACLLYTSPSPRDS